MRIIAIFLLLLLAGCSGLNTQPDPVYASQPTPATVAVRGLPATAEQRLIWGGRVQALTNLSDRTRIEVLSYPLNRQRRPLASQPATGRFLVEMPGFVEPHSYPQGTPVTVTGRFAGVIEGRVGQAAYRFPLLAGERIETWAQQPEDRRDSPDVRWSLGVGTHGSGVGVGIGF